MRHCLYRFDLVRDSKSDILARLWRISEGPIFNILVLNLADGHLFHSFLGWSESAQFKNTTVRDAGNWPRPDTRHGHNVNAMKCNLTLDRSRQCGQKNAAYTTVLTKWHLWETIFSSRERKKNVAAVGFEPTPPKRLVPKTSALDHSATLPAVRNRG